VTIKETGPARAHSTRPPCWQARRYPSDLTDPQWQVIAGYLPRYRPGGRGRPRIWPLRQIVDAILYVDRTGCPWRYLPASFPPWQTVYGYFAAWRDDGTLPRLHSELRAQVRAAAGRDAQPTAAVIDSQSVRAADTVPKATRGWDAAKKVNGRKRHIAVDTTGLLLDVVITAASVQDRDAARPLLWNLRRACPRVRLAWADSGYQARRLTAWATALRITLQIVRRPDDLHTFTVLPRRWVVERTFAWISKHRRTVRDYEKLPASHEAMILWAMIALMTRRLAHPTHLSDTHLVIGSRALAGFGSELGDPLRADAQQRGHITHGQSARDKLGGRPAGAGGRSGRQIVRLAPQAPHLQRRGIQLRVPSVVVVVQNKLWHGLIGQIGRQHNDLADRLVQGWKTACISVGAL
jgi:transposase